MSLLANQVGPQMIELGKILLGMACAAGVIWLFLKVLEFSKPSPLMEYLNRRNRIQTLFGEKDKDSRD
jgi:hypothetical protein